MILTSYRNIIARLSFYDRASDHPVSGQAKAFRYVKLSACFFFSFAIFLSGCKTVSPVSFERGKAPPRIGMEEFSPVWRPFSPEEIPGFFYCRARLVEPKLELWAVKADLNEAPLRIVVNGGAGAATGKIFSTKVSSFVRDRGLLAGINTVPFDPVSAAEGEERSCVGIVVSGGVISALPVSGYDALVFYKEPNDPEGGIPAPFPKAAILPQSGIKNPAELENAVGGFRIILADGELPERLLNVTASPRHPRSAAGLSHNGGILYLLVIDGRRPGSAGATEAETGLILKKLGSEQGLNFDGGGSTALALRFPDGKVRAVNTPIHNGIPGRERAVAACLGLAEMKNEVR